MSSADNSWIILTGSSRGLGHALASAFRRQGFKVCSLVRKGSVEQARPVSDKCIAWDLEAAWTLNPAEELLQFVSSHAVIGYVHGAGLLGPMSEKPDPREGVAWNAWWQSYHATMRVNHTAGVEILCAIRASLQAWKVGENKRAPFVAHISSGAAIKPYVGWDAYCSSKAAILMEFKCLAAAFDADQLGVFSIAPGTIMTDMMRQVLAADPNAFPALPKFKSLQNSGGLVDPAQPAAQVARWLLGSTADQLMPWHGELYDVRMNNPLTKS